MRIEIHRKIYIHSSVGKIFISFLHSSLIWLFEVVFLIFLGNGYACGL